MEKKDRKETEVEIERSNWTAEGIKSYQEKSKEWRSTREDTEGIWMEIKEKIKSAIKKNKKKILPWKLGKKD